MLQIGHKNSWVSTSFHGSASVTHLLLQICVLLSGLTWGPVSKLFSFMNIRCSSQAAYIRVQNIYNTAVKSYFTRHIAAVHNEMAKGKLVLAMDTRYDTPGTQYKPNTIKAFNI